MTRRRLRLDLSAVLLVLWLPLPALLIDACASAPPTLSPAATTAFQATRVVKALDVLRDAAIAANEQVPPLISTDSTRQVVTYHKAALLVISQTPGGWRPSITAGLTGLLENLPAAERQQLVPYVTLIQMLVVEVGR